MKFIYLICFRGTGFRDIRYKDKHPLVRAGHCDVAFESEENVILGFHPTETAVKDVGGDEAALRWLREGKSLEGAVQNDTSIFQEAANLAKLQLDELAEQYHVEQENAEEDRTTTVWQIEIKVSDEEFIRIRTQLYQWYNQETLFTYAFPKHDSTARNCATFPAHPQLGIPIPEETGQIVDYIAAMKTYDSIKKWEEA